MRFRNVSYVLILAAALGGGAIFYSKRHTVTRKSPCDFVEAKSVFLNDVYLNIIMPGLARAVLVPEREAQCLPQSYRGRVDFYHFHAPLFIPFNFNHHLDLTLQKDHDLGSLKSFIQDSENVQTLGYQKAGDVITDLKRIYGPNVEKEKFAWIGISINDLDWSREFYGAPAFHPLARMIDKAELKTLLADSKNQIVDLRNAASENESSAITNAIRYKGFAEDIHLHPVEPKDLKIFEPLTTLLTKEHPVILYSENETDYAAYNVATGLRALGFPQVLIYRGGLDDWNGKKIATPLEAPVRIVNAFDLTELSKNRKLLYIDVRSAETFNFYHIKDSKRITVGDYINNKSILSVINVFPGTVPVIVGQNEYDWRPYKVVMSLLKQKPSLAKNLLWYRQGLSDAEFFNNRRKILPESQRLPMEGEKTPRVNTNRKRYSDTIHKPRKVGDFEGQEDQ